MHIKPLSEADSWRTTESRGPWWYKDGNELKKSKSIKIKSSEKDSRVQIRRAKLEDSGNYTCVMENSLGRENATRTVNVQTGECSTATNSSYFCDLIPPP
ncbi:hypothetical protein CRUP_016920 [Coryphaenoides rupestris]|nr:hypothetical protein CRUP_016920 [Coryphaenoides rupestris]